jgi:hypothetical protein
VADYVLQGARYWHDRKRPTTKDVMSQFSPEQRAQILAEARRNVAREVARPGNDAVEPLRTTKEAMTDVDERIAAAIRVEREYLLAVIGEAIGQMLAEQHETQMTELAQQMERLWKMTHELQATLATCQRVTKIERGEPFKDQFN